MLVCFSLNISIRLFFYFDMIYSVVKLAYWKTHWPLKEAKAAINKVHYFRECLYMYMYIYMCIYTIFKYIYINVSVYLTD